MAPNNNRSHDDLMSLLRTMDDDSSFVNKSITTTAANSHSPYGHYSHSSSSGGGDPMCYSDRSSTNDAKNSAAGKKMTAAAIPGLRRRSGTPTDETASRTSSTTNSSSSSAACGNVLRTMFLGGNGKTNNANHPGSDSSEEGLDLAKYPILQITVPFFLFAALGTKYMAQNFPYVLAPAAASHTYQPARWRYDAENTHFDNTAWTYGTDYWLTAAMLVLAARCLRATPSGRMGDPSATSSLPLRVRSAALLILYGISTLAGGYAHHYYHGVDELNTVSFRILWTICVGTVTSAGAAMLWIGSEFCRQYHANVGGSEIRFRVPTMPTWFCAAWGCYITALCVGGDLSYKRPACDIFVAGTTQTFPTAYLVLLVAAHRWTGGGRRRTEQDPPPAPSHACDRVAMRYRLLWYAGLMLNIPLLPAYPLMVQYTDWSLATVNTLLHAWLTMAWGMQGIALRHFCLALGGDGKKQIKA